MLFHLLVLMSLVGAVFVTGSTGVDTAKQHLALSGAADDAAIFGAAVPLEHCDRVDACAGQNWAGMMRSVAAARAGTAIDPLEICVALVNGPAASPRALSAGHTTAGGTEPCFADTDADADDGMRVQVRLVHPSRLDLLVWHKDFTVETRSEQQSDA